MKTILSAAGRPFRTRLPGALATALLWQLAAPALLLAAEQQSPGTDGALPPLALTGNQATLPLAAAIFKTVGALILVIGLMLLLLAWVKKVGLAGSRPRQGRLIKLLDQQALAPKKQVAVLEVAGAYLVVGISDQQLSLLARLDDNETLRAATRTDGTATGTPAAFAEILRKAAQGLTGTGPNSGGSANAR